MRVIIFLMLLLHGACKGSPNDSTSQSNPAPSKEPATGFQNSPTQAQADSLDKFLKQIEPRLRQLDLRKRKTLEQMLPHPSTPSADSLFVGFHKEYLALARSLNEQLEDNFSVQYKLLSENSGAAPLRGTLRQHGFDVVFSEGMAFVDVSSEYLAQTFGPILTLAMKEYLELRKVEQLARFSEDAGMEISWDTLSDRIVNWERFMGLYPDFIWRDEAARWYEIYLRTYLTGMDNSRVFTLENATLDPEVKKSYERFLSRYGGTKSARVVEEYYGVLRQSGFRDGPAIQTFLQKHKIRSMLGVQPPIR